MHYTEKKVKQMLEERKMEPNAVLASRLGLSEETFVRNLPDRMSSEVPKERFEEVVEQLVGWGRLRVAMGNESSILEVLTRFPRGRHGQGFYNLQDEGCYLEGHLRLSELSSIQLVSQPLMGLESHSVQFFDVYGRSMLKVYLDRDKDQKIVRAQLEMFRSLRFRMGRPAV